MKSLLKNHWPLVVVLTALCVITAIVLASAIPQTNGRLVYAIDDPYIHMAIAKNLVNNGIWGPTPYEYASASSSLLWTLSIALLFSIIGISELVPFILAFLSAAGLLYLSFRLLSILQVPRYISVIVLLLILFITPMLPLIFTGQEHLLHALISIAAVYCATVALVETTKKNRLKRAQIQLLFIAPLVTAARFEGLLLIGVIALLFMFRKRFQYSLLFIVAALTPVIISGSVSIAHGGYFFPNSVLVKSVTSDLLSISGLLEFIQYQTLIKSPYIALLIIATLVLLLMKKSIRSWNTSTIFSTIVLGTALIHIELIRPDWFLRYKAYLVVLLLFTMGILLGEMLPKKIKFNSKKIFTFKHIAASSLLLLALTPHLVIRGYAMLRHLPRATRSIYLQQYQMARFINHHYNGEAVAVNDIGAVSFKSDIQLLDLFGLASNDVAKLMINLEYDREDIAQLSIDADIKVAIVYTFWFERYYGGLPTEWVHVGDWQNPDNMSALGDTVSFYAPNNSEARILIGNLCDFSSELPEGVIEKGAYLNKCDKS